MLFSHLYFLYHPAGPAGSCAAVVPCEVPPARLTGTEPGAECSLGVAHTFGTQAVPQLTLQAFLEE